jgi:hypothetical protein
MEAKIGRCWKKGIFNILKQAPVPKAKKYRVNGGKPSFGDLLARLNILKGL